MSSSYSILVSSEFEKTTLATHFTNFWRSNWRIDTLKLKTTTLLKGYRLPIISFAIFPFEKAIDVRQWLWSDDFSDFYCPSLVSLFSYSFIIYCSLNCFQWIVVMILKIRLILIIKLTTGLDQVNFKIMKTILNVLL